MATKFYTELQMNSNQITGLPATPTDGTSAVSKAYVDSVASGLDVKGSVVTTSTGPVTLSGVGASIGGVTVAANDRVLVKDQATAADNGIYVVASGAWSRAADATVGTGATLSLGAFTFVESGDNAGKGYVLSSANTWTQFSDTGALTAGNGITIISGTVAVKPATGEPLTVDGDGLKLGTVSVAKGGTGATTFTAGYLKANGVNAFTTAATLPITDITTASRQIVGTYTVPTNAHSQAVSTTTLNDTLRANAIVQLFDASGNQVFADVTVGASAVTISTSNNTGSTFQLKYVISV